MSLSLENSTGLTANFGNTVFSSSGAANAQVLTTTATTIATNGVITNFAIRATAVYTSVLDANTGVAPPTILGAQGAVVVTGVSGGVLAFVQGPIVTYPVSPAAAIGQVAFPLPSIPAGFVPIAYQVIKNKNTAGTAGWTYGASAFNAANLSFETAVQVCQLPSAGILNASL